jgi:hypothetical protein
MTCNQLKSQQVKPDYKDCDHEQPINEKEVEKISAAQKIKDGKERKKHYPEPQADDGSPGKEQAKFICKTRECFVLLSFHR